MYELNKIIKKKNTHDDDEDEIGYLLSSMGQPRHYIDPFTPTLYINGPVNADMATHFIQGLKELEFVRRSDFVVVEINTPGGDAIEGFRMLNAMASTSMEVITYCVGQAASMGIFFLAAGKKGKRFAAPLSEIMYHSLAAGARGRLEEMKNAVRGLEKVSNMVTRAFAANCGITVAELEEKVKKTGSTDLILDPWEALKLGAVDHVGHVRVMQARSYQMEVEIAAKPGKVAKKKKKEVVEPKAPPIVLKEKVAVPARLPEEVVYEAIEEEVAPEPEVVAKPEAKPKLKDAPKPKAKTQPKTPAKKKK